MIDDFLNYAAGLFFVLPEALKGGMRNRFVMRARYGVFLALHERGSSYAQIGRWMGRDHSTVIYGCRRARAEMERNPSYRKRVEQLIAWKPKRVDLPGQREDAA